MKSKTKFSQSYGSNQKIVYTLEKNLKTVLHHENEQHPTKEIGFKVKQTLKVYSFNNNLHNMNVLFTYDVISSHS